MLGKRSGALGISVVLILLGGMLVLGYDLLFSKPDHRQGTIIEKIYIPASTASGVTPVGGARRANYFVTTQKQEQWIAIVKTESGEVLQVHCLPDHYKSREVGDPIHFKKYEGKLLHIKYFAH